MPSPSLLQRLKERKLVQWALAYLAGAWVLVEASSLVVGQFHWPEFIGQAITIVAFFGFFVALVLAWYHGEKGRQRVSGPELLMIAVLLVIAVLAGAGAVLYFYVRARRAESQGDKGWVSGPNAMWGKKNNQPSLPAMPQDAMMQFYMQMQTMQQMQMMQQLMGLLSRMATLRLPVGM